MTENQPSLLQKAITHLQQGERAEARALILKELRANPDNLNAWLWALEVAANEREKRSILKKILRLDPTHKGALQYLSRLDEIDIDSVPAQESEPEQETEVAEPTHQDPVIDERPKQKGRPGAILRLFFEWLFSLPPAFGIFALFVVILGSLFVYFRVNTSLLGFAGTDFDELVISNAYQEITAEDTYWEVQYEGVGDSKFIGIVRHVGPIRVNEFRILTHDILVTTAEFADPDVVDTTVIDHKFIWKSTQVASPTGTINLIHAVPANREVYQALLNIQTWDTVKLTGREIYTIKAYQTDGTFLGTWADAGCNTMLIETVSIVKNTDQ